MASSDSTTLSANPREPQGSRAARRGRREGRIPGVVYGGGEDTLTFDVDGRELRGALAQGGAVIELSLEGAGATPVVLKDQQRHPVTGMTMHVDLLRVRLDVAIQATTVIELIGGDDSPGVKEGGILEQVTREVNIEALPTAIPDAIEFDVSGMEINDTITLDQITPPAGVTLIDDLAEITVATLSPPRLQEEEESEIEEETEVVGEGEEPAEGEDGGGDSGDDAAE
jgi:large subunit ribosomal protein L25